ncbi:dihydropteroate synthase [Andreprevotia lacus DSM 23236]|jgi:dihydropteroate synthase|uniref:Dihydropteroate synthase n=1 Tax=Andreprevotia lacus DSM 23236 TaxID=1121001 RepID=A0A1W1WZC7_9NEIS|nr:dihydropteroate synthase [Andreprevotia lacus]SMC17086.1 dihydropteroate synthase [Andreprevotia lacus DSM 23236]
MKQTTLQCGRFQLVLDRPLVMGIVNVTPDSFSDGGHHDSTAAAVAHARQLLADGADLLDIGGESTRPGAAYVPQDEEIARVLPVLQALAPLGVPLSLDTRKPAVMQAALAAGVVDMVNDICALEGEGALALLAQSQAAVCLMHMQGEPQTMQAQPHYDDVVAEVTAYLAARRDAALAAGIAHERIVLDPGFGFGKNLEHNIALFRALPQSIAALGCPQLIGVSRKRMLGDLTGRAVGERMPASVAAALLAAQAGAAVVRVHDVKETVDALKVLRALQ